MLCVVALPSTSMLARVRINVSYCFVVGEIHRRGDLIFNSRSPLSEPVSLDLDSRAYSRRGDYTGEEISDILSFSPL